MAQPPHRTNETAARQVPEALVDKLLLVEEEETGKTLECYAERFAVVDGQRYLAAFPKVRARDEALFDVHQPQDDFAQCSYSSLSQMTMSARGVQALDNRLSRDLAPM